jgi:redox-sensitive bicupin YhaK (pirin superfamily)
VTGRPPRARGLPPGITVRRSADRDHTASAWLDSRHSFAFGTYDRVWSGLGALKVVNEDRIQPGGAFGDHPHWDMEIVTWVLEGTLEHRDSLGFRSVVRAGEVQRLSAGTGIEHSERNAGDDLLRLYQLWIVPAVKGVAPEHEHRAIALDANRLTLLASPGGDAGSLRIHQDAHVFAGLVRQGSAIAHDLGPRRSWIQVADGAVRVDDVDLVAGDGAAIIGRPTVRIAACSDARFLLVDVAG